MASSAPSMPNVATFAARGRVTGTAGQFITFQPADTSYELHLLPSGGKYEGPVGKIVRGIIRVEARKLYTVPSGGNFVAPIFGTPRIIQGRVRHADASMIVVQAGAPIVVELPKSDSAIDLNNGAFGAGSLVNVVAVPGASFELAP